MDDQGKLVISLNERVDRVELAKKSLITTGEGSLMANLQLSGMESIADFER